MKSYFFLIITCNFLLQSCSPVITRFDAQTVNHQIIAVLPIQSQIKLQAKQSEGFPEDQLKEMEIDQAKQVQNHIEIMLLDRNMRVKVQSANITNSSLKKANIDLSMINNYDVREVAKILGVDAVIMGVFETENQMSDKAATAIDIGKRLERTVLNSSFGSSISTITNKAFCNINLYEAQNGDRLWSMTSTVDSKRGETIHDIIEKSLKTLSFDYPYK